MLSPRYLALLSLAVVAHGFHAGAPALPRLAAAPRPIAVTARAPLPALTARPVLAAAAPPPAERPAAAQRALKRVALALALGLLAPAMALASGAAAEHLHLGQKVALFFQRSGLPDWAVLMLISATPAIELRGGVPVGAWMGLAPAATFVICVVGNMAPIAPMLLALRSPFVKKLMAPLLSRADKKLAGLPTGQSRTLALALFVGVPAPGTGAWTGALIAYLLGMPFATSMASILAGVLLAACIMTTLTLAGRAGALVALAVLLVGGAGAILSSINKEDKADGDAPADA